MKIVAVLFCILFINPAFAGIEEHDREAARLQSRGESGPNLIERGQLIARGWRDRRPGEVKPIVAATMRPSDYQNEFHRGTVEHLRNWKNYSFHKVEIPDGSTVEGRNLSQVSPNTDAVVRKPGFGHDLTFKDCNLTNLQTYPDWTLIGSNNAQVDFVLDARGERRPIFVASRSDDVPEVRTRAIGALE